MARLQGAGLLRSLDDADREPVLHRRERVERLDLHVKIDAGRGEAIDADDGGIADRFQDARVAARHGIT
jgi:hypothetical protein